MRTPRHSPFLSRVNLELRRMKQYSTKEAKKERKIARKAKKEEKNRVQVPNPSVEGSLGPPKRDLGWEKDQEGNK